MNKIINYKDVKPFIKWAGGKSQLLEDINSRLPVNLGKDINRYCEPFIGGGAVLIDLISRYEFEEVIINDINKDLINTYRQVKHNVIELINHLEILQNEYISLDYEGRRQCYYEKRQMFNDLKINCNQNINVMKAALFIFLNKTCFNGLYRVNSKGMFNVPIGNYKNPKILDRDNLMAVSSLLKNTAIYCGDYYNCIDFIDNKTFVYIDPPYRPISLSSSFTSYDSSIFDDKEQIRLGRFVKEIVSKDARVIISNSDPKNNDSGDNFFDDLYYNYNIERIEAKRMINSNGEKRGIIKELLIRNYEG